MRTTERLTKLQTWLTAELCTGRMMKTPAHNMDIQQLKTQEPKCYLAWHPSRPDTTGAQQMAETNVCPGILVMPNASKAMGMEEKRFDRYNGVHRPPDLSQTLNLSILFSIYEPGIRLQGFAASNPLDMTLLEEGTEQGLFTLYNWMDDCMELLLRERRIPGTDLSLNESSVDYSLYTDQSYVVDRRPIYYGFVNVSFNCYADTGQPSTVEATLT